MHLWLKIKISGTKASINISSLIQKCIDRFVSDCSSSIFRQLERSYTSYWGLIFSSLHFLDFVQHARNIYWKKKKLHGKALLEYKKHIKFYSNLDLCCTMPGQFCRIQKHAWSNQALSLKPMFMTLLDLYLVINVTELSNRNVKITMALTKLRNLLGLLPNVCSLQSRWVRLVCLFWDQKFSCTELLIKLYLWKRALSSL